MKAGFFDPYLDTIGGGERYTLTLAEHLSKKNWEVDLFWDNPELKGKLESRLSLGLNRVNFIPIPKNLFERWKLSRNYNVFFWLSDGSIPFLFSKKNILHFQVPFHHIGGRSALNWVKLKTIHQVVCNSVFTKKFIDQEYDVDSKVIYPPVDIEKFKPKRKENIILSVGRFSQLLQSKRQDVLIEVFKKIVDKGLTGWKLVLAGGTDIGGKEYFNQLKSKSGSYPIEFLENPEFGVLQDFYGKAKIFWSASGFGINEEKEPERVEHFGITVIEAMAAGCVPIVVGKGGPKEIIEPGKNGFVWQRESELVKITQKLVSTPGLFKELVQNMLESSRKFSKEKYIKEFDEIIR
ncbi:MAG: glycosyltransferase family 4 protein [Patescibacteria group bacterium]